MSSVDGRRKHDLHAPEKSQSSSEAAQPATGLVLCPKTRRELFPAPEVVGSAAASLGTAAGHGHLAAGGLLGDEFARQGFGEGPRWFVTVTPGSVCVSSTDLAKANRVREKELTRRHKRQSARLSRGREGRQLLAKDHQGIGSIDYSFARAGFEAAPLVRGFAVNRNPDLLEIDDEEPAGDRHIYEWSSKSRANMVRRLVSLDYGPLVSDRDLALVTLTYPAEWESVAPDSKACFKHMDAFRKRYSRRWSEPLRCVWKREFQGRGAPHYHLLAAPPGGRAGHREFASWLSDTWSDIVGHADSVEKEKHRLAGTGVDWDKGMAMLDPKRIAVYFAKHGIHAGKDYQNRVPQVWIDGGQSVGRFWGVWGLEKVEAPVVVGGDQAQVVMRTLRRWHSAGERAWITTVLCPDGTPGGRPVPVSRRIRVPVRIVTVWRRLPDKIDLKTGEVTERWRKRKCRRRIRRMSARAGFLSVNDGPAVALMLCRLFDRNAQSSQFGHQLSPIAP